MEIAPAALIALFGREFLSFGLAALFAVTCGVSLFAARMGGRAESLAGAAIAYRYLMMWVLSLEPITSRSDWHTHHNQVMLLDLLVSAFLLLTAVRYRSWFIGVMAYGVLGLAFTTLRLRGDSNYVDFANWNFFCGTVILLALGASTLRAIMKQRRFGLPPAPARRMAAVAGWIVRGLFDPRGRIGRRDYLVWTLGQAAGFVFVILTTAWASAAFTFCVENLRTQALVPLFTALVWIAVAFMYVATTLLFWSTVALSIRRLRDVCAKPVLCLAALLAANQVERLVSTEVFGQTTTGVGYLLTAVLVFWPGRTTKAAPAEPASDLAPLPA